jgi:hypothetical protein
MQFDKGAAMYEREKNLNAEEWEELRESERRQERRRIEAAEMRAERSLDQDGPIDENDI